MQKKAMAEQTKNNNFTVKKVWTTSKETIVQMSDGNTTELYILSQKGVAQKFDKLDPVCKDAVLAKDGTIIYNMYPLDDFWYHQQAARRHKYPYETKYDYQHIYKQPSNPDDIETAAKNSLSCLAKADDTFYGLDGLSTGGHCYVNDEMYKWLLNDNGWARPPVKSIATMLYHAGTLSDAYYPSSEVQLSDYYSPEQLSAKGLFATSAITGVRYNTIYEIPGSIKQDYSKGELIANTFKAKNSLDRQWNMQHSNGSVLKNARQYKGIYSCGGTVWLKYKDNLNYAASESTDAKQVPRWAAELSTDSYNETDVSYTFPEIEVIAAVNRGIEVPQHKSSLYSISLTANALTGLVPNCYTSAVVNVKDDESASTVTQRTVQIPQKERQERIKAILKAEIKNCIRSIAESLQPANCQLFSVNIS